MDARTISSRAQAEKIGNAHGLEAAQSQHEEILREVWPESASLAGDWYSHAAEAASYLGVPERWRSVYYAAYDRAASKLQRELWEQRNASQ